MAAATHLGRDRLIAFMCTAVGNKGYICEEQFGGN